MEVFRSGTDGADIRLSADELLIVVNCLNEACNGLRISEFSTRVGATRNDARDLLAEIAAVYDKTQAR